MSQKTSAELSQKAAGYMLAASNALKRETTKKTQPKPKPKPIKNKK